MSSYLSVLAARAIGQPQSIRPRLASLFEPSVASVPVPDGIAGVRPGRPRAFRDHDEPEPFPVVHPDEPLPSAMTSRSTRISMPVQEAPIVTAEFRIPQRTLEAPGLPPRPVSPATATVMHLPDNGLHFASEPLGPHQNPAGDSGEFKVQPIGISDPRPAAGMQEIRAPEKGTAPGEGRESALRLDPGVESGKTRRDEPRDAALVVRPEASAARRERPTLERSPLERESQSAIRITIGRVDVRAIVPPPSTTPSRKTAASGPLTLDEYLRKRNGVER